MEQLTDKDGDFRSYKNNYTDTAVRFTVTFKSAEALDALINTPDPKSGFSMLEVKLKLFSQKFLSVSNMYLLNDNPQVQKFESATDIIRYHHSNRLRMYQLRKDNLIRQLECSIQTDSGRMRFIQSHIDQTLQMHTMSAEELQAWLTEQEFPQEREEEGYGYLTRMHMSSLTRCKIVKLQQSIEVQQATLAELTATTPEAMWRRDLDDLETSLRSGS